MNQLTLTKQSQTINQIESLIQQSMSLPMSERIYTLECTQSLIYNSFSSVHTLDDTKRLIILYRFIDSVLSRMN